MTLMCLEYLLALSRTARTVLLMTLNFAVYPLHNMFIMKRLTTWKSIQIDKLRPTGFSCFVPTEKQVMQRNKGSNVSSTGFWLCTKFMTKSTNFLDVTVNFLS